MKIPRILDATIDEMLKVKQVAIDLNIEIDSYHSPEFKELSEKYPHIIYDTAYSPTTLCLNKKPDDDDDYQNMSCDDFIKHLRSLNKERDSFFEDLNQTFNEQPKA